MSEMAMKKKQLGRSPAYPSVPLGEALEKAKAQYDQDGKYPAPLSQAFKAWGYSPKSSGGRDVRASLRYFGLITIEGEGDQATVKLSEDALRVITDKREDQSEKKAIIRRLALNPVAHKKLWTKYPDGVVSDASAAHYLQWTEKFNESAAEALVAEFKATASFAGLYEPENGVDKMADKEQGAAEENPPPEVCVGNKIQWTSLGVDQFSSGGTVLAISDDGQWVFTDQGASAVPISEVTIMEQVTPAAGQNPPPTPTHVLAALAAAAAGGVDEKPAAGTQEDKFSLDEGVVSIRFPETMTAASVDDLEAFFALFIKKAKRRAGVQ
jgi:hypothetical protein